MRRLISQHHHHACSLPRSILSSTTAHQQRRGTAAGGKEGVPSKQPPPSWLVDALAQVASRLPEIGQGAPPVAAAQFRALVEDRAPDGVPARVELPLLKAMIEARPELFALTAAPAHGDHPNSWSVLRAPLASATSPSSVSAAPIQPPPPVDAVGTYVKQVRRAIRTLRKQQLNHKSAASAGRTGDGYVALRHIAHHCKWSRQQYNEVVSTVLPMLIKHQHRGGSTSAAPATTAAASPSNSDAQHPPAVDFGIECKPSVRVKPNRRPRGFHIFTDADGLPKEAAQKILSAMAVDQRLSTNVVVRHVSTGQHGTMDTVTPYGLPSHLVVEKEARTLAKSVSVVLKDVLYLCSDQLLPLYSERVAPRISFPHCNVFVCSPSQMVVVSTPAVASSLTPPSADAAEAVGSQVVDARV